MQIILRFALVAVLSFVLHLCWERLHIPLYKDYEALGAGWRLALWATLGDVLYTMVIVLVMTLVLRNLEWIRMPSKTQLGVTALLGFGVALFVEYKALFLHRWAYSASMPIIPVLGIGLSPVAQMTILTPLCIFIASLI